MFSRPFPRLIQGWKSFWIAWVGAGGAFMFLAWISVTFAHREFRSGWIDSYESPLWRAMMFAAGASAGAIAGTGQYLVFRTAFSRKRFFGWIPLTTLGYSLVYGAWAWYYWTHVEVVQAWFPYRGILFGALAGLLVGGLQAPYLAQRIPGLSWWSWVIVSVIGWEVMISAWILMGAGWRVSPWLVWPLKGLLLGAITGSVVAWRLRRDGVRHGADPGRSTA